MSAGKADGIERAVDTGAAATLGVAVGFCAFRLSLGMPVGAAAAIAGFSLCLVALRALGPEARRYRVGDFALAGVPDAEEELVLTEVDRVLEVNHGPAPAIGEASELLLDDVLAELAPDARVVRLFDRAAMPTPGELSARIDQHLRAGRGAAGSEDASQALHDALAGLRRSLR
jgi:hypothetical protein